MRAARWRHGESCAPIDDTQVVSELRSQDHLTWALVHVDDPEGTGRFLVDKLGFHPSEVHDALSDLERPALRQREDGVFLVAPVVRQEEEGEAFTEVAFFLGEDYLVTVNPGVAPVLNEWLERWQRHPDEVGPSPAHLVHGLLDAIVDDYFPVVDSLQDTLDELENQIFEGRRFDVREGLALKRRLLELRRRVAPLRDVINGLLRRDIQFVPAEVRVLLQDVYDHTMRLLENLDVNRDILSSILDAHLTVTSNRLNEVMKFLAVVSTILMTNALIAGIYGMNFVVMPELKWLLGYPFAILLMTVLSAAEWIYFRRRGWV